MDRLKKSLRDGNPFEHKECTQCAFGKILYNDILPKKESYPQNISQLLEVIEELHCDFHRKAFEIEAASTQEEKMTILKEVEGYSLRLINPLLTLKKVIIEVVYSE